MFTSIREFLYQTGEFKLPPVLVFFDTETTGFPSKTKSLEDATQARMVQLGVAVVDTVSRKVVNTLDVVVEVPAIPTPVAQIHGITTEISHDFGMNEQVVAAAFSDLCRDFPLVAFNFEFDAQIINCLFARSGFIADSPTLDGAANQHLCAMRGSKDYAKVPVTEKQAARGMTGYKDPNLMEAYKALVCVDGFENAHSAMADVSALIDVFFSCVDSIIDEDADAKGEAV